MVKSIDVFTSATSFQEDDIREKTVVVVDVLRACSTIVMALKNGAKGVIPVEDMGTASKISQNMDSPHFILSGEKDGTKIEGYDLGNSPLEYTSETVQDKTIILNTTNGTKAIKRSGLAEQIVIGSFLNLNAIVSYLKQIDNDVIFVCGGWKGRLSLEDLLCAGNIIYELNTGTTPENAKDGAKIAFGLYEKFGDDIEDAINSSNYATRLKDVVDEKDLSFCCQRSIMQIVPVLNEGIISDLNGKEK